MLREAKFMKYFAVAAVLLLAGCLEAADLAEERLVGPEYCETPNGIALCPDEES